MKTKKKRTDEKLQERLQQLLAEQPEDEERAEEIDNKIDQIQERIDERTQFQDKHHSTDLEEVFTDDGSLAEALNDNGDDERGTPAEIEDDWQRKAHRKERAQLERKHPHVVTKDIFKAGTHTPYVNLFLGFLVLHPYAASSFTDRQKQGQRNIWNQRRKRFCVFLKRCIVAKLANIFLNQTQRDVMKLPKPARLPDGYEPRNRRHHAIAAAIKQLGLNGGNIPRIERYWDEVQRLIKENELDEDHQIHFQIALATLGEDYRDLSERDLRVLIAVNSCCGEEGWHQVSQETLAMRAVGAWNKGMLTRLRLTPLSRRAVQEALGKLRNRGLIYWVTWRHRVCFVGNANRLTKDKFIDNVTTAVKNRVEQRKQKQDSNVMTTVLEQDGTVSITAKSGSVLSRTTYSCDEEYRD